MGRLIKFRAWFPTALEHGYDKRMIPWEIVLNWHDLGMDLEQQEDIPIKYMQFTGLKDKTGREIYEGDIIKAREAGSKSHIQPIIWGSVEYDIQNCQFTTQMPFHNLEELEVVGNIYESHELLR